MFLFGLDYPRLLCVTLFTSYVNTQIVMQLLALYTTQKVHVKLISKKNHKRVELKYEQNFNNRHSVI